MFASWLFYTLMTMNEVGMLGAFLPEWEHIVCRWQHVIYHTYTGDVHSIFLVEELRRLYRGKYETALPELTQLIREVEDRPALYLGCLLHDIGKGFGGDHSSRGAKRAEATLDVVQDVLQAAGFACTRVDRGGIGNLFARWGDKGHARTFGFNGHTDVVPLGKRADWTADPFGAEIRDGFLYGRGATDMKSGVAAFAAAAAVFSLSEVKLGLVPATISPYVINAIGERQSRRYMLSAERFDAAEAMRIGLVHGVVAAANLDQVIDEMVETLLANGPQAMAEVKAMLDSVTGRRSCRARKVLRVHSLLLRLSVHFLG